MSMSESLDRARELLHAGQHKKAVEELWTAETAARSDPDAAITLLDLATEAREVTSGSLRNDAEMLVGYAQSHLGRLNAAGSSGETNRVRCRALGGFGWEVRPGEPYELAFDAGGVSLHEATAPNALVTIAYADLLAVDIGGPGAFTTGGGFAGGGFGLEGAAEGILAASVLNALTTRRKVITTLSLHTIDGEAFFVHSELTPEDLRIRLSEVFVRMRQAVRGPDRRTQGPNTDSPLTSP
jgi:hypothetical protein